MSGSKEESVIFQRRSLDILEHFIETGEERWDSRLFFVAAMKIATEACDIPAKVLCNSFEIPENTLSEWKNDVNIPTVPARKIVMRRLWDIVQDRLKKRVLH